MTAESVDFHPARASQMYLSRELYLVPLFRSYLQTLPDRIDLPPITGLGPGKKKPSGWFSPSTHPTWPLRDLVLYGIDPSYVPPDQHEFSPESKVSMAVGTFFHVVANRMFRDMGILQSPPEKTCPLCGRPRGYKIGKDVCNEWAVFDHVLRRRGHIDDRVELPGLGVIDIDVKTSAHYAMKHLRDHDADGLREGSELKRKYWAQGQEYMALNGAEQFMFFFVGMGQPWELKEILIRRDQGFIDALEDKYSRARQMAARGEIPQA